MQLSSVALGTPSWAPLRSKDGFEHAMAVTGGEQEATTSMGGVIDACQHSTGLFYSLNCKRGAIITVSLL